MERIERRFSIDIKPNSLNFVARNKLSAGIENLLSDHGLDFKGLRLLDTYVDRFSPRKRSWEHLTNLIHVEVRH